MSSTKDSTTSTSSLVLGLSAAFGGGYAIAYFFGPLPNLDTIRQAMGLTKERTKYDGQVGVSPHVVLFQLICLSLACCDR